MFSKEMSIEINASPEALYDYVSDLNTHPKWAHEQMQMTVDATGPAPVGTTFNTHVKMFGDTTATGKVVTADRPRTFAYECKDSSGQFRWTFTLTPQDGGTHLSHRLERLSAPMWFAALQGVLFYPLFGTKMFKTSLANIKSQVEGAKVG